MWRYETHMCPSKHMHNLLFGHVRFKHQHLRWTFYCRQDTREGQMWLDCEELVLVRSTEFLKFLKVVKQVLMIAHWRPMLRNWRTLSKRFDRNVIVLIWFSCMSAEWRISGFPTVSLNVKILGQSKQICLTCSSFLTESPHLSHLFACWWWIKTVLTTFLSVTQFSHTIGLVLIYIQATVMTRTTGAGIRRPWSTQSTVLTFLRNIHWTLAEQLSSVTLLGSKTVCRFTTIMSAIWLAEKIIKGKSHFYRHPTILCMAYKNNAEASEYVL